MTYYPGTLAKVNSLLSEISAEESAQIFRDEEDYLRIEREAIERDEYQEQVREDCRNNDYSFLK